MNDCIFCKIVNKEISSNIIFEDSKVLAFKDIKPATKIHYLIIPKEHISTINDLQKDNQDFDSDIWSHMTKTCLDIAKNENFADFGYKLQVNCNPGGGQEVYHIHIHLLSEYSALN